MTRTMVRVFFTLDIYYPLANEVAKGYSNATVRPSLRESGTLLIFKVKDQGHRVKFLDKGIRHALRCPCIVIEKLMNIKNKLPLTICY